MKIYKERDMLEEKVLQTICKYHLIEKNDHIVLGVSGGPDSKKKRYWKEPKKKK